jgi:sirohydrochlorin cobaltochelatase
MKRYRHYKKDKAIVLSCFGSVVQQQIYTNLKQIVQEKFPQCDVFLSFSSRMVIKHLQKQGIIYKNLPQILADIDMQGYKNIIVSSINLYPTNEHQVLKDIVKGFKQFSLANIRYTDALLTKTKDTTLFLKELNETISKKDVANLYIIHGTPKLDTIGIDSISYTKELLELLDENNFACSLEGALPFFAIKDMIIKKYKQKGIKQIQIVPLLLVSGNHYIKDMVEITQVLNKDFDAFIVEPITNDEKFNLLNIPTIQQIILNNISEEIIKLGC